MAVPDTAEAVPDTAAARSAPVVAATSASAVSSATAAPVDLISVIADFVGNLPDSPVKSFVEGALTLVRRTLFNRDPVVDPVQTFVLTNGQIFGTVGATDLEGDAVTYQLAEAPQFGVVSIDSGGGYTYTPGVGFAGTDSFTVVADDPGQFNLFKLFGNGVRTTVMVDSGAAAPVGSVIDNFDGAAGSLPNSAIWGYNVGPYLDAGLQTYTTSPDNVRLDGDGHLLIQAQDTGTGYTSARLLTQGKLDMQYGTLVARIKMPAGQGIWPAFWMLGTGYRPISGNDGWPDVGEIDIMELVNNGETYYVTLHGPQNTPDGGTTDYYGGPASGQVVGTQGPINDLTADYHDYWLKWQPGRIVIGVDGQKLGEFTPESLPADAQWVFEAPMFAILQIAVGGPWPGPPDDTTQWPATMSVDSFRYTPYS